MALINILTISVTLVFVPLMRASDFFREKLHGQVGAGNYSYYTLQQDGSIIIFLESLQGDADLYVSDKTKRPTYELDQHDYQSVTCGLDIVKLLHLSGKPLTIAVYGHPSWSVSYYSLEVYVYEIPNKEEFLTSDEESDNSSTGPAKPSIRSVKTRGSKTDFEKEESIIWTILAGLLKILIEVLSS